MARLYKVALDTNMLLYITSHKIDVFAEIRKNFGNVIFIVPQSVRNELERLRKVNANRAKQVNIAEQLMKKNQVKIIKLSNDADNDLLELAKQGTIVATNDKELKKRIKDFGGRVIYLRKKKLIEVM
ncbi:MAG: hypothetical protein J7J87_04865 [Candidatus Diapherotrites archaeon]|uniref:VapC9 PIN-like domain-containing protein n=1 Tax=Candidatus Iainarchaeum sp. TaxID=3101447 RepID=A0A497JH20_9ARCH|nr:hypothetical protein [Candidatus Diapherotrites archaeon]RLG70433.1 MAG: hypothetical protein DRO07_00185 [Candidatus Diapherotrites archaeon]